MLFLMLCCYWYHKGKTFQANHNSFGYVPTYSKVVIDTTKVRLFKQITTCVAFLVMCSLVVIDTTKVRLFKQITTDFLIFHLNSSCYWYHKGKTFQANHNTQKRAVLLTSVVIDTTKVRLFKQITTEDELQAAIDGCYWYHKGKTFQANHNTLATPRGRRQVVIDTTKVRLFKQITTMRRKSPTRRMLLLIPQR